MRYGIAYWLAAMIACSSAAAAAADGHDRARRAVEEGRILPLAEILEKADSAYPGQLIEAELEDGSTDMVYEIKQLTKDGHVMKLLYDARTGELLKAMGHGGRQ